MGEFDELRDQLARHRAEHEELRTAALLVAEAVRRAETRLAARAPATGAPDDDGGALAALRAERDEAERALAAANERGARLAAEFSAFSDPTKGLSRLSDRTPILLLPLRLETRFKTSRSGQPQLWVRVYPDSCLVDGFEGSLTQNEASAAAAFWAAIWRAGGDEGLERAAWRDLVAAIGAGRAGWVVRQLQPANPADKPVRNDASDVLLVIVAPAPLPAAAATYWEAVWRAARDPAATAAARVQLDADVGAAQAAETAEVHRPVNFADAPVPPKTHADTRVVVRVLQLPSATDLDVRTTSWSSPPRVELLPERFVLLAYEAGAAKPLVHVSRPVDPTLVVGPDPNAEPDQQLKPVGDTLQIPDDLAWMFDFERALDVGMALRFDLTPAQAAAGFERILVVGVRLRDTPAAGREELERLLEHHLYSRQGLEILRQGTPTNATEQAGSGYTWRDDPDESFLPLFRQERQFANEPDRVLRRDGQWLAEGLGIDPDLVARVPGAGLADRSEAHAMQIALWPSTLGYVMGSLLTPVFSPHTVEATRSFFTRHVTGRGPLPALRIGNQPYGIQPAVDFGRVAWFRQAAAEGTFGYAARLYGILRQIEDDWRPLVDQVSRVGRGSVAGADGRDAHQVLLDVFGLHPASAEYYPLGADSVAHKAHELSFFSDALARDLFGLFPVNLPLALLRRFGYTGEEVPDLLNKIYRARQTPLDGPVVDDRPLSEDQPIRVYASGRNYIEWLIDTAETGVAALQQEDGFDDGHPPTALLYLMLRHALQLSFRETGLVLKARAGVLGDIELERREPEFVHVRAAGETSESRYAVLFTPDPVVTQDARLLLGDYIARHIRTLEGPLPEHMAALERLSGLPTARLERLLAEHVDTVSYRFDAWKTGLLSWGLEQLRGVRDQREGRAAATGATGLYLGAYGWVEHLRPEGKALVDADLPDDVAGVVNKDDPRPLMADPTNLSLVHAPSLGQATAAAVLRNAHVAHEGRLSVNLSSNRVRAALAVLDGMRSGQSLGALLGYQLERHIHDNGPLTVRAIVYPLRRAFPLVANQLRSTANDGGEAKESIAAMNVVDGRKLLEHVERTGDATYPFGLSTLPRRSAAEEAAVTAAVAHARDVNDAVADLVLSEGMFQAVTGNFDRSAGNLDAFAKGSYPPEPDVVRTPRSGTTLTLRTAVHLPVTGAPNPLPFALTPLAAAEPAVNRWLADLLPAPGDVECNVTFTDRATGTERTVTITQTDLGLHPADLLYRLETAGRPDPALGDLDDRILTHLYATEAPRHDRPIRIAHTERVAGKVTWFELDALLRSLRRVVVATRPLRPADLVRHPDAREADQAAGAIPRARLADAVADLTTSHVPALTALAATLADPTVTVDAAVDAYAATLGPLAAYRLPGTGTGVAYEWRGRAYTAVVDKVADRIATWNQRLTRHDELLADYAALPPTASDQDRLQLLRSAEVLISTSVTTDDDPAAVEAALTAKRTDFVDKRDALQDAVDAARPTLTQLLADVEAELPIDAFDHDPLDLTPEADEVARFRGGLRDAVAALVTELGRRIDTANEALSDHDSAAEAARAEILQRGARALLGEDFLLVPQITLSAAAAAELANAVAYSTSGALTRHLSDAPPAGSGRDFPIDDWLHGVARVREKMHHWENVVLLAGSLPGATAPDLTPTQLPHDPAGAWLALEFPATVKLDTDRLLYTACLAQPFDPTQPVAGLLVDEWTEVIPARHETTGVAFHHDRPNAEPPQAWLLALPAVVDGRWSWDDLVGAVNDALESAKMRAIEPIHVDTTPYSAFLPATHSAWTYPEISISNNFLRNLRVYARLAVD